MFWVLLVWLQVSYIWLLTLSLCLTWCSAVRPSTLAVSMSVPREMRLLTSSLSHAAQAARNTQPSLNPILRFFLLRSPGSRAVSLSCHRLSCSALFMRAELDLVSRDMIRGTLPSLGHNTALLTTGCSQARAGQSHKWQAAGWCWALRPGLLMEARERAESELRLWRERSQSQTRSLARTAVLLSEGWPRAVATAWAGCPLTARPYLARVTQARASHSLHSLAPHLSYESVSCYLLNAIWPEMMETKDAKYDILNCFLLYMTCYLKRAIQFVFLSILLFSSVELINWRYDQSPVGERQHSSSRSWTNCNKNTKLGLSSL